MTGRVPEAAPIAILALILTLAIAAPVLRAPSDRIFGREIIGRHHDPFTVMEQFTRPITAGVYLQPLTDVPGALFARASGPVAAYNWIVLLTFPLSAAAAYALARHLAIAPGAAAFGAIAFAFSPFHLAHAAYHAHIAQTQWLPLYLLALWRSLDAATPAAVAFLAVSAVAVTGSNFYGGLIAAAITPAAVAAYWFFLTRRRSGSWRGVAVTIAALAVIAAGGAAYAWYTAPDVIASPATFAFPRADLFRYSAKWWSYLVPPVGHPMLGSIARGVWNTAGVREGLLEQQVSLGWGVVMLGLVAAGAWLRGGRPAAPLAGVPVLATVAVVALVCSLSPERTIGPFTVTGPSAAFYEVVPMFRAYARFGVVVQLIAVLLAAVGVQRLWYGTRGARVASLLLMAVVAAEYAVWPPALWRDVLPTSAHRWVAQQPGPLRVLDCAPPTPASESVGWLTGYRIGLPHGVLEDCTDPSMAPTLAAAGYTHLLVRRDSPEWQWFDSESAPAGLQIAARFDDGDVFAVTAQAPAVYTARIGGFYTREHDATRTWQWMGPEASWTIVNVRDRPVEAVLELELEAFDRPRRLILLLDGTTVQTLLVAPHRRLHRLGPLTLIPGEHRLVFSPADPPTRADDLLKNGDRRALSFALGAWRWVVDEGGP